MIILFLQRKRERERAGEQMSEQSPMNKLFLMSKFCQPENHNDDDTSSECLQKAFPFVRREICHMSAFLSFSRV